MKNKGENSMTTLMEQIKSVRVDAELAIFVSGDTVLEVEVDYPYQVYIPMSIKQGYELVDGTKYLVSHVINGATENGSISEHLIYRDLMKEDVLALIATHLNDYLNADFLIYEQDDYVTVRDLLKYKGTAVTTFGWVLGQETPVTDQETGRSCQFTVPTYWLANYLSDHSRLSEYVSGDEVSPEWEDDYTHEDGYHIFQAAQEAGRLLDAKIVY